MLFAALCAAEPGERIYRERCASCHGDSGEGVKGKHSEPLQGDRSLPELVRFIEKSMPEDRPGTCTGEEAIAVARYLYDAFYSPIAQARNRKARIELSHLTVRQYRNAVADLVGSFREPAPADARRGLTGEYFNAFRPGRGASVLSRLDPEVRFRFGPSDPASNPAPEKLGTQGFAARWVGAVEAPDTGEYQFIVRTDHSLALWVNDPDRPLIDAWVKSGSGTEFKGSLFLIGGRAYPLKLEFSSRRQGVQDQNKKKKAPEKPVEAFLDLRWKAPGRVEEVIPARHLSPERAPEVFVAATPFPPDDRSTGYDRANSLSRAFDEASTAAAVETAGYVARHLGELARPGGGGDREAKVRGFCAKLVERAFRRPLTVEEKRLYLDRQFGEAPDLEAAVKRVVILALKSPRFLYLDLAAPGEGQAPDAHAVAARLSFTLWDSLPDRELLEAAGGGRLHSPEHVARQAERMLRDRRARSKVRDFFHRWLGLEPPPDLAKDPRLFAGFDEALASDLQASLDLFLDEVVWGEQPDFRRLFLSSDLYLNGKMARYYGLDLPEDAPFQKVPSQKLAGERSPRAGVLTHPYLLARFAYPESSSPIHRGVFIARSLLGRVLRPPPDAFAPLSPDLHPDLTTRERVALQTGPETCQSCHGMINPLGFTLERYDATGRYRQEEHGKAVDASGSYRPLSGETRSFRSARDLAEFLAQSEETHRAFVSQLFHHLVKQPILAYGSGLPGELRRAFAASGFDIRRLLEDIALTVAWEGILDAPASLRYHDPNPDLEPKQF